MIPLSTARIAGSVLCSWGYSRDPGNPACENVALPGFDLCPAHEEISKYLESVAAQWPDDWDEESYPPERSCRRIEPHEAHDYRTYNRKARFHCPGISDELNDYEYGEWEPKSHHPACVKYGDDSQCLVCNV